jgi:hypothetical protein
VEAEPVPLGETVLPTIAVLVEVVFPRTLLAAALAGLAVAVAVQPVLGLSEVPLVMAVPLVGLLPTMAMLALNLQAVAVVDLAVAMVAMVAVVWSI